MVISFGLTVNSISGAFNFITNMVVWGLNNMDTSVSTNEIMGMYTAT